MENDYKEAIRIKFENEKIEGKYSHYLNNPSQALLRDLCWEIFNSEPKADDLTVYRNFFKSEFVPNEQNNSTQYTDKFKKVGSFLKGGKEPAKLSTVELAAILVDFEPRPFQKFVRTAIRGEEENRVVPEELISVDLTTEPKNEKLETTSKETEEKEEEIEKVEVLHAVVDSKPINLLENPKPTIKFPAALKYAGIAVVLLSCIAVYFAFFQKQCMQWSGDHYEKVSCDLEVQGIGLANIIEPLDETIFNLKKVKVCDTTPCFDKNGEAVIWYGKTANGIDFFDGHGRHPENNKPLRPVTQYILNKYVRK